MVVPRAHTAAITGLEILDDNSGSSISILTSSIDQRIKTWDLKVDWSMLGIEGVTMKKKQNFFTPVADVSDMALLASPGGDPAVILCGVGIDIWRSSLLQ